MAASELEQAVFTSLKNLNNLDTLKKLFWSQLNYERVNKSLSLRSAEKAADELVGDPLLLAAAGNDNAFQIIYARLKSDRLARDGERLVVNSLLKEHPYALFVFSNQTQSRWHFLNVKYDSTAEKRNLFRRITVGETEQLRTATEQLSLLDLESINLDASPIEIQTRHDEAFDVEIVTNKFFTQYRQIFAKVEELIKPTFSNSDRRRLFTQKLFNRLMFIAFIQKKGWLKFNRETDYLSALWQDYQRDNRITNKNFYRDRLSHLFFRGLNNPQQRHIAGINNGSYLKYLVGTVPYLNGGLFEEDEDDKDSRIIVPDECLEVILYQLFDCFNFTVTESTPLDIEVAVDPEMLGKVFEELVTGRHESGSYYTPKPIVSFMCREALKGYLGGYEKLIDEHNIDNISVTEARQLLRRLAAVRIVDPACGSGAYLLGMLHELHALYQLLDTRAEQKTARDDYHRKLAIIQNNLYGVDKDEFAVNIARLRLWLSLAVEFEGDEPEPLPNLDFKIASDDSLTAASPENVGQLGMRDELIRQYQESKADYMNTSEGDDRKKALKQQINNLKAEIATWTRSSNAVTGFDWVVEFAEVFTDGGFDIIVANPPYGASVDDNVRNLYFDRRSEGAQSKDTYGLFMARGLQLLRSGGQLCYIVSDTWRTIKSHKPLRKRLLEDTAIAHIIDLPNWIFNATVNTCIFTASKSTPSEEHNLITADLRSIKSGDWQSLTKNLNAIATHSVDIQTTNYARYTYPQSLIANSSNFCFFIGSPKLFSLIFAGQFEKLGKTYVRQSGRKVWSDTGICKIISGIKTGNNSAYVRKLDSSVRGSDLKTIDINKVCSTKDIEKLTEQEIKNGISSRERYFVPLDKGGSSDIDEGWLPNYYVKSEYFIDWSSTAVSSMKQETHSDLANVEFRFKTGITYSRTGEYAPTFRLSAGAILESKSCGLFSEDIDPRALLGILCSKVSRYLTKVFIMHSVETSVGAIGDLPIKKPSEDVLLSLISLTKQIITKQKENPCYPYHLYEQKEIDAVVYRLYGLSQEDIREVELWYCRRYPKLAEAQGIVAEVRQRYADYLALCERVFSKPITYWKSHPILTLIAQGEGSKLEFKETLETDTRTNQRNSSEVNSTLKTITAFLNTEGGIVLIGVSDPGEIKGIERDYVHCNRNNTDGFEQKLRDLLSNRLNPQPFGNIKITFEDLPEGTVCCVNVQSVPKEKIVSFDNEIYIRDGNTSRKITGSTLVNWIQDRQKLNVVK